MIVGQERRFKYLKSLLTYLISKFSYNIYVVYIVSEDSSNNNKKSTEKKVSTSIFILRKYSLC